MKRNQILERAVKYIEENGVTERPEAIAVKLDVSVTTVRRAIKRLAESPTAPKHVRINAKKLIDAERKKAKRAYLYLFAVTTIYLVTLAIGIFCCK